jgi:Chalcone isomerase-like
MDRTAERETGVTGGSSQPEGTEAPIMSRYLASLAFLLCLIPSVDAQAGPPPATLSVEGRAPLTLASQAARRDMLGTVELYTIAVYTNDGTISRELLASSEAPKALRVQVSYDEDPRTKMVIDWRRELLPRLDAGETAHFQGAFAPIQHGDTIIVEYVPGRGTTVRVNKGVAVTGVHHDLMLSFLDHWMGQRPLSEEIKHSLLGR